MMSKQQGYAKDCLINRVRARTLALPGTPVSSSMVRRALGKFS